MENGNQFSVISILYSVTSSRLFFTDYTISIIDYFLILGGNSGVLLYLFKKDRSRESEDRSCKSEYFSDFGLLSSVFFKKDAASPRAATRKLKTYNRGKAELMSSFKKNNETNNQ